MTGYSIVKLIARHVSIPRITYSLYYSNSVMYTYPYKAAVLTAIESLQQFAGCSHLYLTGNDMSQHTKCDYSTKLARV